VLAEEVALARSDCSASSTLRPRRRVAGDADAVDAAADHQKIERAALGNGACLQPCRPALEIRRCVAPDRSLPDSLGRKRIFHNRNPLSRNVVYRYNSVRGDPNRLRRPAHAVIPAKAGMTALDTWLVTRNRPMAGLAAVGNEQLDVVLAQQLGDGRRRRLVGEEGVELARLPSRTIGLRPNLLWSATRKTCLELAMIACDTRTSRG